jgi:hypothetical protein
MKRSLLLCLGTWLLACNPELRVGHYACEAHSDCPTAWYCWSNQRCYDQPEGLVTPDSGPNDLGPRDADPNDRGGPNRDAETSDRDPLLDAEPQADAEPGSDATDDAGEGNDAEPEDAGDAEVPDLGSCDPLFGQGCDRTNHCGSSYNCDGVCSGGTPGPSCPCGAASCQAGSWSACPGPTNFGQDCSTPSQCHGTIACNGSCQGGAPIPSCPCGNPVCEATGWVCPAPPPGFNQSCDTPTQCGGRIACDGTCQGGNPLPVCQCGTPTCGGCVGGTCGANSTCVAGLCQCVVDNCQGCAPGTTCSICGASGNLESCAVDAYDCGLATTTQACNFGCTSTPLACNCSPDLGDYCDAGTCICGCGDFPRPGTINCAGGCTGTRGCVLVCRDQCGICDPICR